MGWHSTWNDDDSGGGGTGRYRHVRVQFGSPGFGGGQATKWLLIANIAVFVLVNVLHWAPLAEWGPLTARLTLRHFQLWRLVTYQFLHGSPMHILMNMWVLWMFGRVVEMQFGTRRFLWLYLLSGIAGGVCEIAVNYLISTRGGAYAGFAEIPIVGASAGVSGVIVAYAILNPNSTILIMFVLPMKARTAAIGWGLVTTFLAVQSFLNPGSGDNVAHAAHLGGMLYAYLWCRAGAQAPLDVGARLRRLFGGADRGGQYRSEGTWRHPVTGTRTPEDDADERRLDEVLRKVHEQGIAALTDDERDFLRRMSERKQDDIGFDNRHRR